MYCIWGPQEGHAKGKELRHREEAAALPRGKLSEQGEAAWHGNDPHPPTISSVGTAREEGRALPHNIHFTSLPGEVGATSSLQNGCCPLGCQSPTHTGRQQTQQAEVLIAT